jgi:hypothetical protein
MYLIAHAIPKGSPNNSCSAFKLSAVDRTVLRESRNLFSPSRAANPVADFRSEEGRPSRHRYEARSNAERLEYRDRRITHGEWCMRTSVDRPASVHFNGEINQTPGQVLVVDGLDQSRSVANKGKGSESMSDRDHLMDVPITA